MSCRRTRRRPSASSSSRSSPAARARRPRARSSSASSCTRWWASPSARAPRDARGSSSCPASPRRTASAARHHDDADDHPASTRGPVRFESVHSMSVPLVPPRRRRRDDAARHLRPRRPHAPRQAPELGRHAGGRAAQRSGRPAGGGGGGGRRHANQRGPSSCGRSGTTYSRGCRCSS